MDFTIGQLTDNHVVVNVAKDTYVIPWTGTIAKAQLYVQAALASTDVAKLNKRVAYRIDTFYGNEFAGFQISGTPKWRSLISEVNLYGWTVIRYDYDARDDESEILETAFNTTWAFPRTIIHHENTEGY